MYVCVSAMFLLESTDENPVTHHQPVVLKHRLTINDIDEVLF